jgi:glucose/arabinose dehydrogenase
MRRIHLIGAFIALAGCSRAADVDTSRLKVPSGFRISVFADTGAKPRMIAFSPGGVLVATSQSDGKVVALPDRKKAGRAEQVKLLLDDLDAPHGIAFHKGKLYIAETNKIVRYDWDESQLRASNPQVITRLPRGGNHFTRTILFHKGKLYVSIGSTCNVCNEADERRAAVLEMNEDGSGQRIFARGVRNAVDLEVNPATGTIWAPENGRDWLGDDLPPEEILDLGNGGDFGWPYCYGDRIPDLKYSRAAAQRCPSTIPPKVKLQAHSAPLGIAFYNADVFPREYRSDLFVAYHGSWNRSIPTGYKVVRVKLNDKQESEGVEDFATGWLPEGESRKGRWSGRPVDVAVGPDGALFITDDFGGAIYRVTWEGK